jgi:hypothetical protein
MPDKGRLQNNAKKQELKQEVFWLHRGGFVPILKLGWCLHSKQFINFIASLIIMVQCWRGNVAGLHLCVFQGTLTLSEWRCKEAPVYQLERC